VPVIVEHRHAVFGGIWIDATVEELHVSDVDVTEHPVEEGTAITDHIRARADVVRLTCMISNQPIELPQSQADGVTKEKKTAKFDKGPPSGLVGVTGGGLVGGAIAGGIGSLLGLNEGAISADGFSPDFNRAGDVYAELLAIKNEGRLFDIETTLRTYESMALVSLEVPRSAENGQGLQFTAVARQVLVVSTETVDLPDPAVNRAVPNNSKGKKPTKPGGLAGAAGVSALGQLAGI